MVLTGANERRGTHKKTWCQPPLFSPSQTSSLRTENLFFYHANVLIYLRSTFYVFELAPSILGPPSCRPNRKPLPRHHPGLPGRPKQRLRRRFIGSSCPKDAVLQPLFLLPPSGNSKRNYSVLGANYSRRPGRNF